jgi:hypothetical protein
MHGWSRIVNAQLQLKRSETDLLTGATTSTIFLSPVIHAHTKSLSSEVAEIRDCFLHELQWQDHRPATDYWSRVSGSGTLAARTSKELSVARSTIASSSSPSPPPCWSFLGLLLVQKEGYGWGQNQLELMRAFTGAAHHRGNALCPQTDVHGNLQCISPCL